MAPSIETPGHITLAEQLGYQRAWCYDSPAIYADVWMTLASAASRTRAIGLGPAVLVPSLRHPLVNASALVTLEALAPGRVAVAFGTGATGRMLLGQSPMRWSEVSNYVRVISALLRGEDAVWDAGKIKMLHPDGFGATRPADIAILIAADGPAGLAQAADLGYGVITTRTSSKWLDDCVHAVRWTAQLAMGSVLDPGEPPTSQRVMAATAPGIAAIYHTVYERKGAAGVDAFPGGRRWRVQVEEFTGSDRHLAIHDGHMIKPNTQDRLIFAEPVANLPRLPFTIPADEARSRLAKIFVAGVSELVYQPTGPDIGRELTAFADAVGLTKF